MGTLHSQVRVELYPCMQMILDLPYFKEKSVEQNFLALCLIVFSIKKCFSSLVVIVHTFWILS